MTTKRTPTGPKQPLLKEGDFVIWKDKWGTVIRAQVTGFRETEIVALATHPDGDRYELRFDPRDLYNGKLTLDPDPPGR